MPLSTNFNVTPYYDDYDENSNYYRILFRPGYAVQARELTQLQTILQKQIERYGQHMFKDGSKVFGGEISLDTDVKSLKLETQEAGTNINAVSFVGTTIVGVSSNARARVVASQATTTSTQPTLMFHYLSGDTFDDGETVAAGTVQATVVSSAGASGLTGAVANGSVVSVDTGVFYVGGFFLFTPANTIIMEAYSSTPSGRVGLELTESTATSDDDNTLLDPASGSYNFAAPGAGRYKIDLTLKSKAITSTDPVAQLADENFIQLLKVINGVKNEEVKYPMYGELAKTLARRTHDESGDYTITPFNLDLKSHRGISGTTAAAGVDGTTVYGNNTLFLSELDIGDQIFLGSNTTTSTIISIANNSRLSVQTTLPTNTPGVIIYNESEFSAGMDAGKAYVKGYEYESIDTHYIDVDKGRSEESITSFSTSSEIGNYLIVDTTSKMFDIGSSEVCQLHSVERGSINTASNTTLASTQVGTARVRSMDWDASSGNTAYADTNHSNYRLYLWDVNTSNNITGTAGAANANNRIVQLNTPSTSYANDAYTGASITVNTTSGIDVTSDVRVIDDYYSNTAVQTFTTVAGQNNVTTGTTSTIAVGMGVVGAGIPATATVATITNSTTFTFSTVVPGVTSTFTTVSSSPTVTAGATASLVVGMTVTGTSIAADTTILSITNTTTFVLSKNAGSGAGSNSLKFNLATASAAVPLTFARHFIVANTVLGQASIANTTYEIDFKIKDVESIVTSELSTTHGALCIVNTGADIADSGKYNNSSSGNTILGNTDKNNLVFSLPQSPIKKTTISGNTVSYMFKKVAKTLSSDAAGKLSITLPDFQFMPGAGSPITRGNARENFI